MLNKIIQQLYTFDHVSSTAPSPLVWLPASVPRLFWLLAFPGALSVFVDASLPALAFFCPLQTQPFLQNRPQQQK